MKATLKKSDQKQDYFVKLRIDKRTVIFVRNETSLRNWLAKYPNAERVL